MGRIGQLGSRAAHFFKTGMWTMKLGDFPWWKSVPIQQLRILWIATYEFIQDKCTIQAASMTYYSLLSIVPAVALFFGVSKGFGFEHLMRDQITRAFPGQEDVHDRIMEFSTSLLESTQGGTIAGIGILILFFTLIKLLYSMENTFNNIWRATQARTWLRKFTDYFTIILIAPILIILGGSLTLFVSTKINHLLQSVAGLGILSSPVSVLLKMLSYFVSWILFTLVYVIIPNARVRIGPALIAGILAGTAYQFTQWAYVTFQVGVSRYNAIYGSLAALPLFMIWVHLSWLIALFGAEYAYAVQYEEGYEFTQKKLRGNPFFIKLLALKIAHLIAKNFADGGKPFSASTIAQTLQMPVPLVEQVLTALIESGTVGRFSNGEARASVYMPARDVQELTISGVLQALENRKMDDLMLEKAREWKDLADVLTRFQEDVKNSAADRRLLDI